MKLEKCQISIARLDDGRDAAFGYCVSGLGISRVQYGWKITHIASGVNLFRQIVGSKELACRVLECLVANAEWTSGEWGVAPKSDEQKKAHKLAAEIAYAKGETDKK